MKRYMKNSTQRGFTLIEALVVLVIMGIVAAVASPKILATMTSGNVSKLMDIAESGAGAWQNLTMRASVTTAVASNPIPAASNTVEDVLFVGGTSTVAASYQSAYTNSKVQPLNQHVIKSGSTFLVSGTSNLSVALTGGGTNPLVFTYSNVPEELVLEAVDRLSPGTALTKDGTTKTIGQLGYNCAAAATTCTFTVSKRVS